MSVFSKILFLVCFPLYAQVDVLTHHANAERSGANLNESNLKVTDITNANFGKLVYRLVDGNLYAQPLIVTNVKVAGRPATNMAVVATENNSVYAFDAEDFSQISTTAKLWQTNLGPSIDSATLYGGIGAPNCIDLTLQIGITGTPAIRITSDTPSKQGVVFVAAKTKNATNYAYTLYALDLITGHKLGSIAIQGDVQGTGVGSVNGRILFQPMYQLNRPALLLDGNTLYIAFGGHCDKGPYHGWVFAYDVTNPKLPKRIAVLCITPNGKGPAFNGETVEGEGGIWMSGEGPALDAMGNIYLATGNGTYNGTTDYSDSVLKLKLVSGKLVVQDWFTPGNQVLLKNYDYDLGSGGVVLIPNSHLALAGGKEGRLYLLDRDNLGKGMKQSLQSFIVTHPLPNPPVGYNIHGTPVVWPRNGEMFVYVEGEESPLVQYRLIPDPAGAGWKFESETPFRVSKESAPYPNFPAGEWVQNRTDRVWMPGGFLTLSAQGAMDGTGILWAVMPFADNANAGVVRGVLRAFNANDVSTGELWDSESTANDNDRLGQFAKFSPPTEANGKVYLGTFQQESVLNGKHVKTIGGDQPALVIYGPRSLKPVP